MNLSRAAAVGFAIFQSTQVCAQDPKPAKNLLENGDFSAGMTRWTGDGKAEIFKQVDPVSGSKTGSSLDGLKTLAPPGKPLQALPPLPATPPPQRPPLGAPPAKPGAGLDRSYCIALGAKSQKFSQRFSVPRTAKVLQVTFRARPADGFHTERTTLGAFQARVQIPGGRFIYFDRKVELVPEWQTYSCDYTVTDTSRYLDLIIEVFPGAGQLYFDDFVIDALEH